MRILCNLLAGLLLLSTVNVYAAINNISEEDGSPSQFPWKLKVTNGALTDNGDGTASLSMALVSDIPSISDTAYDATSWNGNLDGASKNAIRDKFEALAPPFQTTSNVANLVTATDTVTIGSAAALAKLAVDGDTDEIQLLIQGHSTQTSSLAVFENSAGTDLVTISNTGVITTAANSSAAGYLDLFEDTDDGSNKTRIQVQAMAADITLTLPVNDGDASQFLQTDGSGVLTWVTSSGTGDITSIGDVASGAAFDGTQGTTLTFNNAGGDKTLDYDGTDFLFNAPLSVDASDPADSGAIRLDNAELIAWEASLAGTDVTLTVNSSEQFVFSDAILSPTLVTPVLGVATYTTLSGGAVTDSSLTSGRVQLSGTAGLSADDSDLTFATDTLTVTKIAATTLSGTATLAENSSIALDPAGSADGKYTGITVTGTGGATIAFGDLVTLDKDDSRWELVDISVAAAATGDARGVFGIAVTSSTDGAAITVLLHGIVRADANFPVLTIGAPVYASTTGDIVVTQPTTVDYVIRIIGAAMTADELYFNPDNSWTTHT